MDADRLLDRVLSAAPLAVLVYLARRHESERARLLRALETDRESFRGERRELLNRLHFPTVMPTGTRPVDRQPSPLAAAGNSPAEKAREAWQQVGTVSSLLPNDDDEVAG